jgi:peroxiredoxin
MKFAKTILCTLLASQYVDVFQTEAFVINPTIITSKLVTTESSPQNQNQKQQQRLYSQSNSDTEDCGCAAPTVYTGKPPDAVLNNKINHRAVISDLPIYRIDGSTTTIDDILSDNEQDTSLVVFLRSLGWPFCQEQIVQYNRIRSKLLTTNNINLIIISIGTPEKGTKLASHLELDYDDCLSYLYVDPDNVTYDALQLNFGIASTFASIDTPLTFRDRIFGTNGRKDGMNDLLDVLSKWKDAIYLPPKQEQAFQQGGAFIFKGEETVFAHYDASAGAHIEVMDVVNRAIQVAKE